MKPRSLPKGNIFRELYDRPEDVVACFDLLMTRRRISECRNSKTLSALAQELRKLADESIAETISISQRTMHGRKWGIALKKPLDFSPAVRSLLIQDTIILIFDIHRAIEQELLPIDIALGTWLLFVAHSAQNILDSLLAKGILARGALGCGTLLDSQNLVLGTSFIDAYDHIEGESRKPILGLQVTPALLRYQNWINDYLNHIRCSVGEFLHNRAYLVHHGGVFVDPGVRDRDIYELRLRLLRALGCSEKFLFGTADFYMSSLAGWTGKSDFWNTSFWEHAKYRAGSSQELVECRQWFEGWRQRNTRLGIGLMHENVEGHAQIRKRDEEIAKAVAETRPNNAVQPPSREKRASKKAGRVRAARG